MKPPKKRGFGVLPGWWACGDLGRVVHLESTEAPSPFPTFCPMHPFHLASPELYPFIYISFYQLQTPQWKAQDTELGRKQFSVGVGLTLHKDESIRCHWKHLGPKDLSTCIIHKTVKYKLLQDSDVKTCSWAQKCKQEQAVTPTLVRVLLPGHPRYQCSSVPPSLCWTHCVGFCALGETALLPVWKE